MDLGDRAFKPSAYPQAGYSWGPKGGAGGGDETGVVARHGYYRDDNNRAELVYDLSNTLGNHPNANWYAEVVADGTLVDRVDLGVGVGDPQMFSIGCGIAPDYDDRWLFAVDRTNEAEIVNNVGRMGEGTWRWYVETTEDVDKEWRMRPEGGARLYRR